MRAVDLTWAGGEHPFLLTIDLLRALQDRCDAGPAHVLKRLGDGTWRVDDVIQPIRLGLEGGGMGKTEAREMVTRHVEDRPLTASVLTAQAIMMAALYSGDEADRGKAKAPASGTRKRTRAG